MSEDQQQGSGVAPGEEGSGAPSPEGNTQQGATNETPLPGVSEGPAPAGEGTGEPAGSEKTSGSPVATEPKPPKRDWRDQRIDRLTGRNRELEEELARRAEPAKPPAAEGPVQAAQPSPTDPAFAQAVAAEAARVKYLERTQEVYNSGVNKFGAEKFQAALRQFNSAETTRGTPKLAGLVNVVLAMENPHEVLYEVASDPELTERLLGLSPVQQTLELAKRTMAKPAPATQTKTPAPLAANASGANARGTLDPADPASADKMSMADWMAARRQQVKQRVGRGA